MAMESLTKPAAYTPDGVKSNYDDNIDATNADFTELYAATGCGTTGAAQLPAGTTAQRPGTPVAGMIRLNTTTNKVEAYVNGTWADLH